MSTIPILPHRLPGVDVRLHRFLGLSPTRLSSFQKPVTSLLGPQITGYFGWHQLGCSQVASATTSPPSFHLTISSLTRIHESTFFFLLYWYIKASVPLATFSTRDQFLWKTSFPRTRQWEIVSRIIQHMHCVPFIYYYIVIYNEIIATTHHKVEVSGSPELVFLQIDSSICGSYGDSDKSSGIGFLMRHLRPSHVHFTVGFMLIARI